MAFLDPAPSYAACPPIPQSTLDGVYRRAHTNPALSSYHQSSQFRALARLILLGMRNWGQPVEVEHLTVRDMARQTNLCPCCRATSPEQG